MAEMVVRQMTQTEFDDWRSRAIKVYAEEQVAAGNWAAGEAERLAAEGHDALLPDGFDTPGMLFLLAHDPDGNRVGILWLSLTHPRGVPDCGFIYDIEVDEAYRGAGYGRALLTAAENELRSRGVRSLGLNVFGDNTPAVRLYESSGYRVVTQQMVKPLD
ncbi:N-acetyltransferase [Actinoplanes ianthinogenes]|uniref:N-acetyltransferase n=1 Tax=Actinoplanes ianthinogenes TaxID=122358 RepID=A0ABM7LPR5_9ACTN|nr:GNAT family N-acetyltransferase [Actinoplanes ianthinogenes]BCJ41267.1 N-acetyltransferase [Actinoplanes ianthinogenes]GGR21787.1 N-acetyltransferase [Actinoplanes ianthinogenes]